MSLALARIDTGVGFGWFAMIAQKWATHRGLLIRCAFLLNFDRPVSLPKSFLGRRRPLIRHQNQSLFQFVLSLDRLGFDIPR